MRPRVEKISSHVFGCHCPAPLVFTSRPELRLSLLIPLFYRKQRAQGQADMGGGDFAIKITLSEPSLIEGRDDDDSFPGLMKTPRVLRHAGAAMGPFGPAIVWRRGASPWFWASLAPRRGPGTIRGASAASPR